MIDNEIIQEIRQNREKLWEESGCDTKQFFEMLMERQKNRLNLVGVVRQAEESETVAEESKTRAYNSKN